MSEHAASRHHGQRPIGDHAPCRRCARCLGNCAHVVSAHRTPERLYAYAREAAGRGLKVIIEARGAAHLPGMAAAMTTLPFWRTGRSAERHGQPLSIVQMPGEFRSIARHRKGWATMPGSLPARSLRFRPRSRRTARDWRAARPTVWRPTLHDAHSSGSTIGIIGGGQLRPDAEHGCGSTGLSLPYLRPEAAAPPLTSARNGSRANMATPKSPCLARDVSVITFEFENIDPAPLKPLAEANPTSRSWPGSGRTG